MGRSEGQKPLTIMVKEGFLEAITQAYQVAGYSDRSQFIRDAVFAAIENMGLEVERSLKAAPSRMGKGGPKKKTMPPFFDAKLRSSERPT
jgi:hypothetical protein